MEISFEQLLDIVDRGSPEERLALAQRLAPNFLPQMQEAMRSGALEDVRQNFWPRVTVNDVDVKNNSAGTAIWGGQSRFAVLDFPGATGWIDTNDGNTVHIRTAGGGADCLFDYLVSGCYLTQTLFTFTEGMVFTTASGCTYKGYSTVGGAAAQATIDFPPAQLIVPVIAICGGTYSETNITVAGRQHWIGAGRARTIIGSTAASITTNTVNLSAGVSGGAVLYLQNLMIQASTGGGGTAGGLAVNGSSTIWAENCEFGATGATAARAALLTNAGNTNTAYLTHCNFSTGYDISYTGLNNAVRAVNCAFAGVVAAASLSQFSGACSWIGSGASLVLPPTCNNIQVGGDVMFDACTLAINVTAATVNGLQLDGINFRNCTTGIDFTATGSSTSQSNVLRNLKFDGTTSPIKWPTLGGVAMLAGWCYDNISDTAMFSGTTPPFDMACWNNYEFGGLGVAGNTKWTNGIMGLAAHNSLLSDTLKIPQFYIYFGTTRVSVAAISFAYVGTGTFFVSVSNVGVVTFNTVGAFPANEFPLAVVTVVAGPRISAIDWHDAILRTTASGASPMLKPLVGFIAFGGDPVNGVTIGP